MKKAVVLLLCLGLLGCATVAKYEIKLDTLVGKGEDFLIATWGVPDKEYHLNNGKKAIEYVHKSTIRIGGYAYAQPQIIYQSGILGGKVYSGVSTRYLIETAPKERYRLSCNTSFIINSSGKVESWHHQGNNCIAR